MKLVSPTVFSGIRGTVTLVSLCFVAVMGITLAGYIAVCSRAMNLSNRTFQGNLSKQLAEVGIDEALRAFNKNDWSDWSTSGTAADWTVSGTTATANLTFPAGKFGQGVTGSVKIRVDNYNSARLDTPVWNSSTSYRVNDLVGHNGIWYRCLQASTGNTPPDLRYWAEAPIPWNWSTNITYSQYDVVNYNGIWYRYFSGTASSGNIPATDTTRWNKIISSRTWSSGTAYELYDVVTSSGVEYHCVTAHTSSGWATDSANWSAIPLRSLSLSWSNNTTYPKGALVLSSGAWYYCYKAHISSGSITTSNTSYWAPMLDSSGAVSDPSITTYFTGTAYSVGDYVFRSSNSTWYRCIASQPYTSSGVGVDTGDSSMWVSSSRPDIAWAYRSGATYDYNDVVYYGSTSPSWYRCTVASATSTPTTTTDWENALSGSLHAWSNSSINYNLGDVVYYSTNSRWYRCIRAHPSSAFSPPTNTTNWTTVPLFSTAWDSNKQYNQYDTVHYNGAWYLALSGNSGTLPASNPGTWALAPSSLAAWDSAKYYNLNDTISYSGTWYRCILAHTNQTTTNTTYWSSTLGASYQWNATTAYAVGVYRCYGGVWYKCTATTTANANHTPNNTSYWTAAWANSSGVTTGAPVVYAEGTIAITGSPSIKTQLRATIAPAPLFPNAVAATTTIDANSGGTVDSYDSTTGTVAVQNGVANTTTPNFNNGTYASHVGASTNYSAVVAVGATVTSLASTTVKGYVAMPSPPTGIGGSVKGLSSPASPNIDLTRVSRSPNIPQFDTVPGGAGGLATNWATVPKGTQLPTTGTTINLGTPGATTPSRYFHYGTYTIGDGSITNVKINGPVILYINRDLFITASGSTGRIDIATTGSAEIHVAGAFKADAGGEGIVNYTSSPKSLIIISDTTSTATHFYSEGVNDLYGVIYIPYSTSNTGYYNNNTNTEIFGAISANKITYSGANMNVHYDTSLRYATFGGVDQPYTVSQWRELPVTEQATLP